MAEYQVILANEGADPELAQQHLQQKIHMALVQEYLDCDYASVSFKIAAVTTTSSIEDAVECTSASASSNPIINNNRDASSCYMGSMSMELTVFVPPPLPPNNGIRHLREEQTGTTTTAADPNNDVVTASLASFLTSHMDSGVWSSADDGILELDFLGFRAEGDEEQDDENSNDAAVNGAVSATTKQTASTKDESSNNQGIVIGSTILGLAVLCLAVIGIALAVHKKHHSQDDSFYLKQVNDNDAGSVLSTVSTDPRALDSDGKVLLVLEEDDGGEGEGGMEASSRRPHTPSNGSMDPVHRCSSATCPECQPIALGRPNFVSTTTYSQQQPTSFTLEARDILRELGPIAMNRQRRLGGDGSASSSSVMTPDTVEL